MSTELVFESLDPISIPVSVGSRKFLLREATVAAACEFENAANACTVYNDKGFRCGVKGLADVDSILVAKCLLEVKDGGYSSVSLDEVRGWPDRIQRVLYQKVREISGMNYVETEEELLKQKTEIEKRLVLLKNGAAAKNGESTSETASS